MALRGDVALALLDSIGNANAKGEYYLTDAVAAAVARRERAVVVAAPEDEVAGVNDRAQLAEAERLMQARLRSAAMANGVTLVDPASVHLCADTRLGRDVVIEPHVVFGPGVGVADDVLIRAFSHLEGAEIGAGAIVGPFARLRPGSRLGAGTITCNYDGIHKHRTIVGEGVFVGTNSSLVAPLRIGDRAYIGSGSVITDDVPSGRSSRKAGPAARRRPVEGCGPQVSRNGATRLGKLLA